MKIVVTGISSFVGVHLAVHFSESGHSVTGTVTRPLESYDGIRSERLTLAGRAGVHIGQLDITDENGLIDFVHSESPDVWIHHAGWATKYSSLDYDLLRGHITNVQPLAMLYPALRDSGCRGIIMTGSSMEYSNVDFACEEDHPCWPETPYGLSKLTQTLRARQLSELTGVKTRLARLFIPLGPLDAPQKLIPSVIRGLKNSVPIELTPCEQSRDFLFMHDLVRGYERLMDDLERDPLFDVFNICQGESTRLHDLLIHMAHEFGADSDLLKFGARNMRAGEAMVSYGSNEKAQVILGWKPEPLKKALKRFLDNERNPSVL